MLAKFMAATLVGQDSAQVEVEVNLADGLPITVVGGVLADWEWDLIMRPRALSRKRRNCEKKGPALLASNLPCEHVEHGMHGSELRESHSLPGFSSLPGALHAGAVGRMSRPPV